MTVECADDFAGVIATFPVAYMGGKSGNMPKAMGAGLIVFSIGCLLFALPQVNPLSIGSSRRGTLTLFPLACAPSFYSQATSL